MDGFGRRASGFGRRHLPGIVIGVAVLACLALFLAVTKLRTHAAVTGSVLLFVLILWRVPKWQIQGIEGKVSATELADLENKHRATLAQILGGAIVLGGLYFTWQGVQTSWEGLALTRDREQTERFTRAVEQLGNDDKVEVRLGGVYALGRIAWESEKDYRTAMEVLTSFVRRKQRWEEDRASKPAGLQEDVQAALRVLAARNPEFRHKFEKESDPPLDLHGTDLRGAFLPGCVLGRVDLREAHLTGARLGGADLRGAILREAHLKELSTDLRGARLEGADLRRAHLERARLGGTLFDSSSNLGGAYLQGARLWEARLRGAHLAWARLEQSKLWGADLGKANLENAWLDGAELQAYESHPPAKLDGAKLMRASFKGAVLDGVDLRGADLTGAKGLTREQLQSAIVDETTVLPDDLQD